MVGEEKPTTEAELKPSKNEQPPSGDKYSLEVDEDGVVSNTNFSSEVPPGYTEVTKDIWLEAQQKVGEVVYEDGALVDIDEAQEPTPTA